MGLPVSASTSEPTLVVVGGFLGSGKTTLLLRAASQLAKAGRRVGLILNDQAGELVDTRWARAGGLLAEEVASGCFCCRFSEFMAAAGRLLASSPEVIFAEPVGSCADLSATVLQPLRRWHQGRFRIAPLTVLADPERTRELLAPGADPDLAYLFRQQIEEADIVLVSKADLQPAGTPLPRVDAVGVSAVTGQGVHAWLDAVLSKPSIAGGRLLDIDYLRYANAEASLGWLNWHADLRCSKALTPASVAGPFLDRLDRLLTEAGAGIVHMKIFVQSGTGCLKASVCRNSARPTVEGSLDAAPARSLEIVLNVRAKADPAQLTAALNAASKTLTGRVQVRYVECFRPAAPKPEYRLKEGA